MPQSGPWLIHKTGNCINSGNRICTWTQINTKEQRIFQLPLDLLIDSRTFQLFAKGGRQFQTFLFTPARNPFYFLAIPGAIYTFQLCQELFILQIKPYWGAAVRLKNIKFLLFRFIFRNIIRDKRYMKYIFCAGRSGAIISLLLGIKCWFTYNISPTSF